MQGRRQGEGARSSSSLTDSRGRGGRATTLRPPKLSQGRFGGIMRRRGGKVNHPEPEGQQTWLRWWPSPHTGIQGHEPPFLSARLATINASRSPEERTAETRQKRKGEDRGERARRGGGAAQGRDPEGRKGAPPQRPQPGKEDTRKKSAGARGAKGPKGRGRGPEGRGHYQDKAETRSRTREGKEEGGKEGRGAVSPPPPCETK